MNMIILDVMLPGKNGFEVIHELRTSQITTPVIMLTARDEVSSKITGLDNGADDYMTKPFEPEELLYLYVHYPGVKMIWFLKK